MLAYIGGPIDDVDDAERTNWVDGLCKILTEVGVNTYRPVYAMCQTNFLREDAFAICEINRNAIRYCDLMIAKLCGPGRGFGTIREIELARQLGLRVIVIGTLVSLEARDVEQVDPALFLQAETWRRLLRTDRGFPPGIVGREGPRE